MAGSRFHIITWTSCLLAISLGSLFFWSRWPVPAVSYTLIVQPGPGSESGRIEGRILYFINGNPTNLDRGWGHMKIKPITGWLVPGENVIAIEGERPGPLELSILRRVGDGETETLIENEIPPSAVSPRVEARFRAEGIPRYPIFEAENEIPDDREAIRAEVTELLRRFHQEVTGREVDRVLERVLEGARIRRDLGDPGVRNLTPYEAMIRGIFSDREVEFGPFDPAKLEILYGKNAIFAYAATVAGGERDGDPCLFTYTKGGETNPILPARLVRIGGRWVFWGP